MAITNTIKTYYASTANFYRNAMDIRRTVTPQIRQLQARNNISVSISGPNRQSYTLPQWVLPGPRTYDTVIKQMGYRPETIDQALQMTRDLVKAGTIKDGANVDLADVILGKYDLITGNIGAYCGQEGKAAITEWLAGQNVDIVIRHQGGDNCDYTVEHNGHKYTLTLLPVGIFMPKVKNILGNAMMINVINLLKEISAVESVLKTPLEGRLMVSGRAHVVMPYHTTLRKYEETVRAQRKLGGCNTGVGPASADKYARRGITINDLFKPERLREVLEENVPQYNREIACLVKRGKKINVELEPVEYKVEELMAEFLELGQRLNPYVIAGVDSVIQEAIENGRRILCQGVQAAMVDINHGSYPNCTSSGTLIGAIAENLGIDPQLISNKVGTVKAYNTRSHAGAFPTEISPDSADEFDRSAYLHMLEKGIEYDRIFPEGGHGGVDLEIDQNVSNRIGWIDMVFLKDSVKKNGLTQIAVTKLDVLSGLPKIRICTGYIHHGETFDTMPDSPAILKKVWPVYEEMPGWEMDISNVRSFSELPKPAQAYLKRIAQLANARIGIVSVGPDHDQKFWVPPYEFDSLVK